MIYFVQAVDGGPIKIGTTEDFDERHRALERYYGCELALLAEMPGDRKREQEIHAQFSHLRLGRTEQFRPEKDLLEFIGKPLFVAATEVVAMKINPDSRETTIRIGCSQDFKTWLERIAKIRRVSSSVLIEIALADFAERNGLELAPER